MQVLIDALGYRLSEEPAEVVAWQDVNDGLRLIYERKSEHVHHLVAVLRREAALVGQEPAAALLSEDHWMTTACARRGGACAGDCAEGSCQETSFGHIHFCHCA